MEDHALVVDRRRELRVEREAGLQKSDERALLMKEAERRRREQATPIEHLRRNPSFLARPYAGDDSADLLENLHIERKALLAGRVRERARDRGRRLKRFDEEIFVRARLVAGIPRDEFRVGEERGPLLREELCQVALD